MSAQGVSRLRGLWRVRLRPLSAMGEPTHWAFGAVQSVGACFSAMVGQTARRGLERMASVLSWMALEGAKQTRRSLREGPVDTAWGRK